MKVGKRGQDRGVEPGCRVGGQHGRTGPSQNLDGSECHSGKLKLLSLGNETPPRQFLRDISLVVLPDRTWKGTGKVQHGGSRAAGRMRNGDLKQNSK